MQTRTLTVKELQRQRYDRATLRSTYTDVPAITLAGRWVEAAGFTPGLAVVVTVEAGRLVVEPARSADVPPAIPGDALALLQALPESAAVRRLAGR